MDIGGWSSFFFAQVGASAALTGLLFVGVSINLNKILSTKALPNRALQALVFLLTVLVVSSLLLVPQQGQSVIGGEVLTAGVVMWAVVLIIDIRTRRTIDAAFRREISTNIALNQITALPYVIAGVSILVWGSGGIYWLVPAVLLSIIKAMMDAWVLLIEINR
ncbi:MAG: hypothetical protein KF716_16490 [Anaerolineae bacterium]|nr:hypothetical protein [Anaerolineae bacterium]